ncbi:MAG: septum formation initiator family protein [Nitrospinota bacterium]|nr:septum formation initiator family protein [Nitrospinota bacterium]
MKIAKIGKRLWENRKRGTVIFLGISMLFLIFMILISLVREDGIVRIWELEDKLEELKGEIVEIKKKNKRLESEVIDFKEYDSQVEKVAREELGLVKEGETLYKFVPSKKGEEQPPELHSK